MKTTQILYILCFLGIVLFIATSTNLLESSTEGFSSKSLDTIMENAKVVVPKGVERTKSKAEMIPDIAKPGGLPFGPYLQTASVGSYQYQDPSIMPAELKQMKALLQTLESFLAFEANAIASSSDPSVSLPLTHLRADNSRLQQEVAVLEKNPGIASTLSQQDLADIEGSLSFLQRKARLFQTAGIVSNGVEGFQDQGRMPKTRATKEELQELQTKVYGAILTLTASGTVDPLVQARVTKLQAMYTETSDMITKLDKGFWTAEDVPVFKEDITTILPNLSKPSDPLMDLSAQDDGMPMSPVEEQLAQLVGRNNAKPVFKSLVKNGSFGVSVDLGYNIPGDPKGSSIHYTKDISIGSGNRASAQKVDGPFDPGMSGMDDRAEVVQKQNTPGHLDWKQRATGICDQIKQRGLDPLDFGCIPQGSIMSPAYSWRGHTKMVCGRLGSTTDPDLPRVSGCPPSDWKGWTLPTCLAPPNSKGSPKTMPPECGKGIFDLSSGK